MDRQAIIMLVTAYTHNTAVITYGVSHQYINMMKIVLISELHHLTYTCIMFTNTNTKFKGKYMCSE